MKGKNGHIGIQKRAVAWLMLLPLFVFLFFSCPVKRALFSAASPAKTVVYSDITRTTDAATTLSGGDQPFCCQNIALFEKDPVLQPFHIAITPAPVAVLPASLHFNPAVFWRSAGPSARHYEPAFYHIHLFLENRALLI